MSEAGGAALPRGPGKAEFAALLLLVLLGRWLPHLPNFTPLGAVALYLGACYRPGGAVAVLLSALLLSDLVLGFYAPVTMAAVYLGTLAGVPCGFLLRLRRNAGRFLGAVLGSSGLFFLVSNTGVWLGGELYPHTLYGYGACLWLALPFYVPTLAACTCYLPLLFGLRRWWERVATRSSGTPAPQT